MTSINSTPAEIQQKILRYVISVDVVLDPDAIASTDILAMSEYHACSPKSKWNDMRPYWSTERDRNSCRRVCVSWNIYLEEKIGHRYVRMIDIVHGKLSASALRNAIRVSFYIHGRGMLCKFCEGKGPSALRRAEFLRDTLTDVGETRTQIITSAVSLDLAILADHMPDTVTITELAGGDDLGDSITRFRQLRHLHVDSPGLYSKTHILDTPNLQSFSFTPRVLMRTDFAQPGWNLRNLRTLSMLPCSIGLAGPPTERVIKPLLRAIGPNLKSLFLPSVYLTYFTAEIWEICPNLENITATKSGSLIEGLPSSHPLHTVIIPCHNEKWSLMDVPTSRVFPESSQIRTVVVDCPWGHKFPETLIRSWADHWMRYSIHVKDIYGVPVQDWIAILDQGKVGDAYP
jgi:hypothetical protein